jgi:hypothetical protein
MKLSDALDKFIEDQALQSALRAALQRNALYKKKPSSETDSDKVKREFRDVWKTKMREKSLKYMKGKVEFAKYYEDLVGIMDEMQAYIQSLDAVKQNYFLGFKFSHAQKSFSLFLKYRWCHGKVHEPPFFPLDREIFEKLKELLPNSTKKTKSWTVISADQFKAIALKSLDKGIRSDWELEAWNNIGS